MKILITGAAGFIGSNVVRNLIKNKENIIVGLDNINSYYDICLKESRLSSLTGIKQSKIAYNKLTKSDSTDNYSFIQLDLEDKENLNKLFVKEKFDVICNLAAQAGVRYSIENPYEYINSNIIGFLNILELSKDNNIKHLVYASSSSVYGLNQSVPFSEEDSVDHPISIYAATKRSNELMAHVYSKLYNLPTTGLRFFTVYGPWGRPDMAPFLFTDAIIKNRSINVFNNGDMLRDFTYINDISEAVVKIIYKPAEINTSWDPLIPKPNSSHTPFKIFNIGNSSPIKLIDFISTLEKYIGKKAHIEFKPMQPGDVYQTNANTTYLNQYIGFKPTTTLDEGIKEFISWYKDYYLI